MIQPATLSPASPRAALSSPLPPANFPFAWTQQSANQSSIDIPGGLRAALDGSGFQVSAASIKGALNRAAC